jgi:ubiquinone/menaquinone biosynthesis C-methylase UbiE
MLLHVGCGNTAKPECFGDMQEVRLDISPECQPDILASMTDMGDIGPFDALYSSHSLEHLYPHEVPLAAREFHRVLRDGGVAVVVVPDLTDAKPTEDALYDSPAGPVCGLDLYYGMARLITENPHMAHHSGFIASTLKAVFEGAGFAHVETRRVANYNLMALAQK